MKKLTTLIIVLSVNNLFSQTKNKDVPYYVRKSELRISQTSYASFSPYLYTQIYFKVNKNLGFWNYSYLRNTYFNQYQKSILGPCFMNKNLVIGLGCGMDSKGLKAFGTTFAFNYHRFDFSFYGEHVKTEWRIDYFDITELNIDLGKEGKYKIGLYNQTRVGTGLQFTVKISRDISLTIGTGYTTNKYAHKQYSFVPKINLIMKL